MMFLCVSWLIINFAMLFGQYNCNDSESYRQEAAKVLYSNPKYLSDIKVYTFRRTRSSPYLTTANATTLQPWENNVTLMIDCVSTKLKREIFSMDFKICEVLKLSWAKAWLKEYTNVPYDCPVPVATYIFKDIELPPKNFPIPIPAGDYSIGLFFLMTKTREKILDIKVNLKFQNPKFK